MQPSRQSYLDWLRILAIIGVLFFHSAMPFVAEWEWHIKNKETSNLLMEINFFLSRFRMPLLFFISGAVAFFMLQKRTAAQFIRLRFRRLLIPLLFGMLLLVPVQVYMERLNQGLKGSFFDFYPTVFTTGPYPKGNLSWHHLWFIAYLLVYDVLLAPLFKMLITHKHKFSFFYWFGKGTRIYTLLLPSVLLFSLLVLHFPETHDLVNDWCWLIYWFFFLVAGFVCVCFSSLINSLERNRRTSLSLAVITILLINYCRWNNLEPDVLFRDWRADIRTNLYYSLFAFTAWFWVFALIGYGKHYLNKKKNVLNYINSAVYPFYILHQTIIVVIAWYVVQTGDSILMKYGFVIVATFFITVLLYHLFVRPFALMRFLFGVKKEKQPRPILQSKINEVKEVLPLPV